MGRTKPLFKLDFQDFLFVWVSLRAKRPPLPSYKQSLVCPPLHQWSETPSTRLALPTGSRPPYGGSLAHHGLFHHQCKRERRHDFYDYLEGGRGDYPVFFRFAEDSAVTSLPYLSPSHP